MIESEKDLERKLNRGVKKLLGLTFKFVPLFVAGIPDRICLLPGGRIFFAEIKTTKQKPKKLQLFWHAKLRKLGFRVRSEEHTSELQSRENLVCRLLLEKKKKKK